MFLNTLSPSTGSRPARKRVGRGIGSGTGKTCGRGHKGQKSRNGGFRKVGFEGGQMPLQRRLPKVGFHARKSTFSAQIRLNELALVEGDVVDIESLKKAGLINKSILRVKVFASGKIESAVTVKGLGVSKGAREAIEASGGKVEE